MSANYLTMKPLFSLALTLSPGVKLVFSNSKQASKQKTPKPRSGLPYSEISECLTLQCGYYRPLVWLGKFRGQG